MCWVLKLQIIIWRSYWQLPKKASLHKHTYSLAALMRSVTSFPCVHCVLQTHLKCILNKLFRTEYLFMSPGFHSDLLVGWITYWNVIFWNSALGNLLRMIFKHFSLKIQARKCLCRAVLDETISREDLACATCTLIWQVLPRLTLTSCGFA